MSIKQVVFTYLDRQNPGSLITGRGLQRMVWNTTGRNPYPATCLRYLREWRAVDGRSVPNVSKRKSLYQIKEVK